MIQYDFLVPSYQQEFDDWVHTPQGGQVANLFIRLAIGCHRRGVKVGARAIWERIRWHYNVRKVPGDDYRLQDHFHAYMSRFAMERAIELKGYFALREVGKTRKNRNILILRQPAKPAILAIAKSTPQFTVGHYGN